MMWDSYKSRDEAENFFANVVEKHSWFKAICLGTEVVGSITLDKGKGVHSCNAGFSKALTPSKGFKERT